MSKLPYFVAILSFFLSPAIQGEISPDSVHSDYAKGTLENAANACKSIQSLTYDFTYEGVGSLAGHFTGKVRLLKSDSPGAGFIWIEMAVPEVHGGVQSPKRLTIATNAKMIQSIDERRRTLSQGSIATSGHLLSYAYYGVLFQFLQPNPFEIELKGPLQNAGTQKINGVLCDVIKAENNSFGGADVWWYLGREDKMPHAQKWVATQPGVQGEFLFRISNLATNTKLTEQNFHLTAPEGYKFIDEDNRKIAVGERAPDWVLSAQSGTKVHLSDLEGTVVVLDFWASWCPPCWTFMPILENLRKQYADKKVLFFGVSAWESPDIDPITYAQEKGIGYKILLHGEEIASQYKIFGLPALFVIDAKGNFAYLQNPVASNPEEVSKELVAAIANALQKSS